MGIYRKFFLAVSLLIMLPAISSHAQVSKIVFTTDPQTIKPSELSGPITIQTQDSLDNLYQTPETIDLEFISTSTTAEFLGSTGNPVTKTMSKNTANRTFYYRDSMEGTFTITINAKGRDSGVAWSASQIVIISNSLPTSTSTTTTPTATPATPTSSTSSKTANTSTVTTSTHYSAAPLTNTEVDAKFEIGAGRNRLGIVGMPLEFKAETTKDYLKNTQIKWSFGDGAIGYGQAVTHSYEYTGDYVVIVNVSSPEGQAVSRTNVKIIPADISISHASPERIEISNNSSNSEVNLFGRALISGNKVFSFPQDTIIAARQKISFGAVVTGLEPSSLTSVYLMVVGSNPKNTDIAVEMEKQRLKQIASIQTQISELQQKLVVSVKQVKQEENKQLLPVPDIDVEDQSELQTALVVEAVPETRPGIINSWLQTLRRFFLRTQ